MNKTIIVWIRKDFRLVDNSALFRAELKKEWLYLFISMTTTKKAQWEVQEMVFHHAVE